MRIALCAPFMEADLLGQKIKESAREEAILIDEYNRVETLLSLPWLDMYDAVWVALSGAVGMEAVFALRARSPDVSIVWVSDDEGFMAMGAGFRLAMFLTPGSTKQELRIAIENSRQERRCAV